MAGRDPHGGKPATIGEKLGQARRRRLVGREAEIEQFRAAIEAPDPDFSLFFIHGPGGIGKTVLLDALAAEAETAGVEPVRLDLRAVEPSPTGFSSGLAQALGLDGRDDPLRFLTDGPRRVLMLDTYEAAAGLDGWLRQVFLPELPRDIAVVIAGRAGPDQDWLTDPGWGSVLRNLPLRNLERNDARTLLARAGVPEELRERAFRLTHGHPLAVALVVDVLAQAGPDADPLGEPLDLAATPDVLPPLVQRFAADAPTERHRDALHIAARAQFTTEGLLRSALPGEGSDAAELFAWLRGLSFVEQGPHGLFPHDLARDVIVADLRWRDQTAFADLHRRVRAHLVERIAASEGATLRQVVKEAMFLHRANPLVSSYWDWDTFSRVHADKMAPADRPRLLEMIERHEGAGSAAIAELWMERQPHGFVVTRMGGSEPVGVAGVIALHEASDSDLKMDPGALSMWEHAQRHSPPRPGEQVRAARFLVDGDAYQGPSPTWNLAALVLLFDILSWPRLSWDFICHFADADAFEPLLSYIDYHRARDADFEVEGVPRAVFAHDWRRLSVERWLDLMIDREIGLGFDPDDAAPPVLALSKADFGQTVRDGLRELHRTEALASSPLMRSRSLRDRGGERATPEDLRDLLEEAIDTLRTDSRDEKLHRALSRTYVRPAKTQELAAEALGLPFSTYRRHLTRGIERVVEWLWQRELYGPEG